MDSEMIIPLAGIALPAVLVPTIMAFRHTAKKREYDHLERMKALETGQPVPGEVAWPAAMVCALIGAGVPVGSFFFTFLAWINSNSPQEEIWLAPVAVSALALLTTKKLATSLFRSAAPSGPSPYALNAKLAVDREAYDMAGYHG